MMAGQSSGFSGRLPKTKRPPSAERFGKNFRAKLSLYVNFDEEDFCNFVKRGGWIELVSISNNVVARVKQVCEFIFFKSLKF